MVSSVWHCVCHSSHSIWWSHILDRRCTCLSVYVYMFCAWPPNVCFRLQLAYLHGKMGVFSCSTVFACSHSPLLLCSHNLVYNVYMHQYMNLCQPEFWLSMCAPLPLKMLTWKHGMSPMTLWICQLHYFLSHILVRMCTCISTCTSVYLTPNVCFTPLAYLHGKMGSSVWHCVCLPVTLLLVHTLFKMGACISTLILGPNLTAHISSTPFEEFHENMVAPVWHCVFVTIICFWSHTLFKMCTCISTLIYVLTWLHMSVPPHLYSFMKTWMPLCDIVCLSQSAYFWLHTFVRMCTCISTCIYVHLTPHFSLIPCG